MSETLVRAHRRDLEELLRLALGDLDLVWRQITTADAAREALMDLLPELSAMYGAAAATLAADWYDEMREAAEVDGRFRAIPVDLPDREQTDILARWAVGPLFAEEPDFDSAKSLAAGGFYRLVADADRETILRSLRSDPRGTGWSRRTTGKSCSFCQMIAGRGAVYSAETANFSSHNSCDCLAVPVIGDDTREVKPYVPSQKFSTQQQRDANNARLREYLRTT